MSDFVLNVYDYIEINAVHFDNLKLQQDSSYTSINDLKWYIQKTAFQILTPLFTHAN